MEANQKPNSVESQIIPTKNLQSQMLNSTDVLEELLWKVLNFTTLKQSSISFFDNTKPETTVSRWARAMTRASKVGKGSSKDEKAQKLYIKHWLEVIDPRHRYGVNLNRYHDVWCNSESSQPFFYWLDIGDGKEVNVEKCSRSDLESQCIKYLGPKEREAYEVIIKNGKLIYKKSGVCVETIEGTKWIYVLSSSRILYVGEKQRHHFHHSSFIAGAASLSSGRLIVSEGNLEAIWAYSGHYRPTEEHFEEIINFLQDHHLDLTNVKKYAIDDDIPRVTNDSKDDANKNSTNEVVISHAAWRKC